MRVQPFERVLAEHRDRVYRYLTVAAGPDAADCFQETFLAALRAWPPRDASSPLAWLLTIAHRKAVDAHRRRARRPVPVAEVPEQPSGDPLPDPGLWAAVARLPDKQRRAIELRFVADLPYALIGGVLGCTDAAARQNVRAGLARLREEYGDA